MTRCVRVSLTVLVFLLLLVLLFGISVFAEGESASSFDSFEVKEEYRAIAEEKDLLASYKRHSDDCDGNYAVLYDAIITEYCPENSVKEKLKNGVTTLTESDFSEHPTLYVPIVNTDTSNPVAYAQIIYSNGHNRYGVYWMTGKEAVITEKGLNATPGINSSYLLLASGNERFVYAPQVNGFYRYTEILSIQDDKMRYTAEEVVEYPDEQERQSKWEFFKEILLPIIVKLVLFCFLIQIVIASAIVGTALLIVSLRRRNKKRETQTDGSSSDKT